jgi:hypothetical protein
LIQFDPRAPFQILKSSAFDDFRNVQYEWIIAEACSNQIAKWELQSAPKLVASFYLGAGRDKSRVFFREFVLLDPPGKPPDIVDCFPEEVDDQ